MQDKNTATINALQKHKYCRYHCVLKKFEFKKKSKTGKMSITN